ncbi:unnamed protein product [Blepharisma stoltei]|uniref:RRM domain-containing protein n=1 Tax=Blepharisma stoltei TaxID=1481888 RepID=A0AAU9K494_9CILI|nr:unnamed protein product [Blepharisma stoltei]
MKDKERSKKVAGKSEVKERKLHKKDKEPLKKEEKSEVVESKNIEKEETIEKPKSRSLRNQKKLKEPIEEDKKEPEQEVDTKKKAKNSPKTKAKIEPEVELPKKRKSKNEAEPPKKKNKPDATKKPAPPKKVEDPDIVIGGLSFEAKPNDISDFLSTCGKIKKISIPTKGVAIVKFETLEECKEAIKKSGQNLLGRPIRISMSQGLSNIPKKPISKKASVYLGNISNKTTEESIKNFFKDCGDVKDIQIPLDTEGNRKGFAFVEFYQVKATDEAVELDGRKLDGNEVKVNYLAQRTKISKNKPHKGEKITKVRKLFKKAKH